MSGQAEIAWPAASSSESYQRLWGRARDSAGRLLYWALIVLTYVGTVAPMVVIVVSSFSNTLFFTFPPKGFSTLSYEKFWADETMRGGLTVSVLVALATMVIALLLAAPAAYAIDRFRFPGRGILQTWLMSPMMLPVLVLAVGLVMLISQMRIPRSFWVLVMAHVLVSAPFALQVLLTALSGFDRTLEEASASLGARPLATLRRVTMPVLQPGILSAAVLAFVMSFGQITMSIFLVGEGMTTLPVQIFLIADWGYDVAITAVSVVVMLVALVVLTIVEMTTGLERVL